MSDVADCAKAELVLDELDQRTRLLKLVRGRPSFPWFVIPVVLGYFVLLLCPWDVPERVFDTYGFLAIVYIVLGELDKDTRKLRKRFDALVKVLEQDGVLRDGLPAHGE